MDLLDLLAPIEAADPTTPQPPVHLLMPNMSLACGRDTLTTLRARGGQKVITTSTTRATSAECLAVPDLAERVSRMNRSQA